MSTAAVEVVRAALRDGHLLTDEEMSAATVESMRAQMRDGHLLTNEEMESLRLAMEPLDPKTGKPLPTDDELLA